MTTKISPYIHQTGDIIIPFTSDSKYHFWNGGQHLTETLAELNAPEDVWGRHTEKPCPGNADCAGYMDSGKIIEP
jgi:hypothetical protein